MWLVGHLNEETQRRFKIKNFLRAVNRQCTVLAFKGEKEKKIMFTKCSSEGPQVPKGGSPYLYLGNFEVICQLSSIRN